MPGARPSLRGCDAREDGLPPVITQAPPRLGEERRGAVHYSVREAAGGWTEGVTSVRVSSSTGDLVGQCRAEEGLFSTDSNLSINPMYVMNLKLKLL